MPERRDGPAIVSASAGEQRLWLASAAPPARGLRPVLTRLSFDSRVGYFLSSDGQFNTTVTSRRGSSVRTSLTRNRLPSALAAY